VINNPVKLSRHENSNSLQQLLRATHILRFFAKAKRRSTKLPTTLWVVDIDHLLGGSAIRRELGQIALMNSVIKWAP